MLRTIFAVGLMAILGLIALILRDLWVLVRGALRDTRTRAQDRGGRIPDLSRDPNLEPRHGPAHPPTVVGCVNARTAPEPSTNQTI